MAPTETYSDHLRSRWPSRTILLCLQGLVITSAWAGLEWLTALEAGQPWGASQIGPRMVPALLAPTGILMVRLVRSRPTLLQALSLLWSVLFVVLTDLAFFRVGSRGTLLHGVAFYTCVLSVCTVLPLLHVQRRGIMVAIALAHVALEMFWPDGRTVAARLLACAHLATGAFSVVLVLELFFARYQRNFQLRGEMKAALQTLTDNRGRIGDAAQGLSSSVGQLGESAQSLSERTLQTQSESQAMAIACEQISSSARALFERSQASALRVTSASEYAERVDALTGEIERHVADLERAVGTTESSFRALQERSERIREFVEAVKEIAAQTQMLAINAGIEASHAGEHGRGFAVIASQVRELAEQAGLSSRDVKSVVGELGAQMRSSVQALSEVRERTRKCQIAFEQTRSALKQLEDVVSSMREATEANALDADLQAKGTQHISAATARLLDLVQAQTEMSTEVAGTAATLELLAESLRSLLPAERAA